MTGKVISDPNSFFRYSTTSTVTNSKKEINTTNNTPEEDQSKNTEMEGSSEKKMEDYSEVLTAKTANNLLTSYIICT